MTENKHGFMPTEKIKIGGINFTIIQTAEAVDMMKHIAAVWNIKPEEIFIP